jgi:hypothetical protein
MTFDTTLPTLSLTSLNAGGFFKGGSSQNITWTSSDTNIASNPISILYSTDGSIYSPIVSNVANSGSYAWTLPSINNATVKLKITASDLAGNIKTITSSNFLIDSSLPVLSALTSPGDLGNVTNRNVLMSLTANDSFINITAICFKINSLTQPITSDSCWVNLNTIAGQANAQNISVVDYPIQLGTISGVYKISSFVRDEAGNISALTNSGNGTEGVDLLTLTYTSNPAPVVSNVLASNTNTPTDPITPGEQIASLGSTIYIQWSATDDVALPTNAIKIQYTTNDTTFTDVVSNLANGANNGCTVNAGYTGCYLWTNGSPSNSFLRFKIIANDQDSNSSSVSNPLNTGSVNFLAGNTDHGIGGSAASAIFTSYNESGYNDGFDDRQIVATKTGFVFVRSSFDDSILYIDPISGAVNYLLKKTGADTGDGGSVFSATLKGVTYLSLDHQDNLLIFSSERVRKVDLQSTPWTISTLFGGGATISNSSNPTVAATSLSISAAVATPSVATPAGKLYFFNSRTLSYYDYSDNLVHYVLDFNGLGATGTSAEYSSFDVTTCAVRERALGFNIATGVVDKVMSRFTQTASAACGANASTSNAIANFDASTGTSTSPHPPSVSWATDIFSGLDGQIYALWHGRTTIKKYIKASNTWTTILGTGIAGRCADGTAALTCNGIFMSAFINSLGTLYFIDMGVIRYIDSNGKVQTLFGQRRDFGIGYSPLSSRFSLLNSFALNGNDVYLVNTNERKITKYSLTGGNVSHVAGNSTAGTFTYGSQATTQPLTDTCGWSNSCMIQVDPVNNRLYFAKNNMANLSYVDLVTGLWQVNTISGTPVTSNLLGIDPSSSRIFGYFGYTSTSANASAAFVFYDYNNLTNTRIYGPSASTATPPADARMCWDSGTSTQLSTCDGLVLNMKYTQDNGVVTRVPFDTFDSTWKVTTRTGYKIYSLPSSGSTTFSLYTTVTSSSIVSFDIYNDGVTPIIYYCGSNGRLYKRNVNTAVETNLPIPLTSMTCAGSSLYYHPGRNSVIFAYKQNLLYGIAEYRNP